MVICIGPKGWILYKYNKFKSGLPKILIQKIFVYIKQYLKDRGVSSITNPFPLVCYHPGTEKNLEEGQIFFHVVWARFCILAWFYPLQIFQTKLSRLKSQQIKTFTSNYQFYFLVFIHSIYIPIYLFIRLWKNQPT